MELKNKKINFLGDSITYGAGVSGPEKIFLNVLKERVGLAEARNYGIGGTRYAVQTGTWYRPKDDYVDVNSFAERYDEMDNDADVVVVFGGTNDFGHGDAPLGRFEDRSPDSFYGACHYLFTGLIKKYPGKPIVIMTPTHRCNERCRYCGEKQIISGMLEDYVNIIRKVAEYYSLPVLDLYACSGMQPEVDVIREMYIPDGLHPNDAGHAVIAAKLEKFLRDLYKL